MNRRISPTEISLSASKRMVLDLVRRHGPVSRAELVALCDLGPASVTLLTRDLIEQEMIVEAGRRSGGRGQPAIDLLVSPDAAYSIGISPTVDSVVIAALDFAGHRRGERVFHNTSATFEAAIEDILCGVNALISEHSLDPSRFVGAGLAVSASFTDGDLAPFPSKSLDAWKGTDIVARVRDALDLPVWIENDANAATIAENLIGNPAGYESFVYLYLSEGIGGGVVVNGKPWRGARGNAGEFGVLIPRPEPRPTVEDLRRHLKTHGYEFATPDRIGRVFGESPELFQDWLDASGPRIASLLIAASAAVDPDGIILGGTMPAPILRELAGRVAFAHEFRGNQLRMVQPPITVSDMSGELAAAIGAATLPFSSLRATAKRSRK